MSQCNIIYTPVYDIISSRRHVSISLTIRYYICKIFNKITTDFPNYALNKMQLAYMFFARNYAHNWIHNSYSR